MTKRALVAMSGGVDSSVAACLIKEQGYETIGITLKLFNHEDIGESGEKTCCSLDDIEDARRVAETLDIPYYVLNFKDSFGEQVIRRFVDAYTDGATPNPCVDCNRYIKFARLMERARELRCDYVVTGHYAQIAYDRGSGRYLLKKGLDESKDQSYVLYSLTQDQLAHTLLPLGGLTKAQARQIAGDHGFINAHKRDSQDICFVRDGDYARFIEEYTGHSFPPGNFVDRQGRVLGRHKGIIRYTIGQRKGLGVPFDSPLYVYAKNAADNTVILTPEEDLFTTTLEAADINLIALPRLDGPLRVTAKARYRQPAQAATLEQLAADRIRLTFDKPQRAIAKGQAVVFYDGDIVVGGGRIL